MFIQYSNNAVRSVINSAISDVENGIREIVNRNTR